MRALVIVPALLAVVVLATGSPSAGQTAARPNVVVVMSDDQTVESLRVMSNVRTLLQTQGTTFANSFASYPLCCPSRSTFLTGQYAHNHGVLSNMPPTGGFTKLDHTNTLPVWLQRAGYHTVHIGKYLNGYRQGVTPDLPLGWSEWYGSYDPTTYRFYDYTLNENGKPVMYGSDPGSYQADVYTAKAVTAIARLAPRAQPFFLSVAYLAPHSGGPREPDDPGGLGTPVPAPRHKDRFASEPLPTPPSFNETDVSDKPARIRNRPLLRPGRVAAVTENYRQRLESLLALDEGVAAIVAALRATGELGRTLIVFTSDNGFFHGEHRVQNGKVLVYEPSVRVPLVMRGPGVPRGSVDARLVGNVDLAPTILDAADAKAGRRLDGRSLIVLLAKQDEGRKRDILLETQEYAAVRTLRYVWVEHATGERELYDLQRDPYELESRHDDPAYAATRADLERRLAKLRRCAGSNCATR
jgi:N-acetylglucosamine-6-sulfatase